MTRVDLRAALDLLPRYFPSSKKNHYARWTPDGSRIQTNARETPKTVDRLLGQIVTRYDAASMVPIVKWVDVTGNNIWVLHKHLRSRSLEWLYRRNWKWQKMPFSKLPIYIFYHGKIVVWNGTHRMTLGRLAHKRVRARVIDIDQYLRWEKKHGKPKSTPRRVLRVQPCKKAKRKQRRA